MFIRDRIKELRRVEARQLIPNAKNWRTHPESQKNALRGLLAEIGFADALLARELPDGRLELIDGHLRAETTPDMRVPVLVLDVNEEEADKLLATLDPLAAMAGKNDEMFSELADTLRTENHAVRDLLDSVLSKNAEMFSDTFTEINTETNSSYPTDNSEDTKNRHSRFSGGSDENPGGISPEKNSREVNIPEIFQVVVECESEDHQREIYDKLTAEGHSCRLLNL